MSADQLRNSTYLHATGAGSFKDEGRGAHAGTPSIGNTDKVRQAVRVLLGTDAVLTSNKSVDLDRVYGSASHNSLGLQVAISGRADVVQSDVAAHLGEYQGEFLLEGGVGGKFPLTDFRISFRRPHQVGPFGCRGQRAARHCPPPLCRWRQGRNYPRTCSWTVRFLSPRACFDFCSRTPFFSRTVAVKEEEREVVMAR